MALTTRQDSETPAAARYLLTRVQREVAAPTNRVIMEIIATTIVSYRFEQWSRAEVEAMPNITFEETRLSQELREEAHAKGLAEGRQLGIEEGRQEGARSLVLRQPTRRLGDLPTEVRTSIEALALAQLEALGEAFPTLEDLRRWLAQL